MIGCKLGHFRSSLSPWMDLRQRKVQVPVLRESGMAPHAVDRYPNQLGVMLLELWKDLVVQSHLISTHRAPVRWIKRKDDRLAAQIAERELLVRSYGKAEVGSG